ncbi:unnamed protein product [Meganyctiphanes norvegica]|uniref:BZIP domain-containing protein n=1 Tax=Meganyctiphanes norvegica TaxID=48144 RepID=A0AAV2SHN0_MEGNR
MAHQRNNYNLSHGEILSDQSYSYVQGTFNEPANYSISGALSGEDGYSAGPSSSNLDQQTHLGPAVVGPRSDLHPWNSQDNQTMNYNYLRNLQTNSSPNDLNNFFNNDNYSAACSANTPFTSPSSIQPISNCCPDMVPNSSVTLIQCSRTAKWELPPKDDPVEELKRQRAIRLHNNREKNRRHEEDLTQSLRQLKTEVDQLQIKKSNAMKRIHDLRKHV